MHVGLAITPSCRGSVELGPGASPASAASKHATRWPTNAGAPSSGAGTGPRTESGCASKRSELKATQSSGPVTEAKGESLGTARSRHDTAPVSGTMVPR